MNWGKCSKCQDDHVDQIIWWNKSSLLPELYSVSLIRCWANYSNQGSANINTESPKNEALFRITIMLFFSDKPCESNNVADNFTQTNVVTNFVIKQSTTNETLHDSIENWTCDYDCNEVEDAVEENNVETKESYEDVDEDEGDSDQQTETTGDTSFVEHVIICSEDDKGDEDGSEK